MDLTSTTRHRWVGWHPWRFAAAATAAAALVVAADAAFLLSGSTVFDVGYIPQVWSLPAAAALLVLVGADRIGVSRPQLAAWREYYLFVVAVGAVGAALFTAAAGSAVDLAGLVLASASEEVSYRLAAPLALGAVLHRQGRWSSAAWTFRSRIVIFVAAAAYFTVLPGHVAQIDSAAEILPLVMLSVLQLLVVHRTGTLLPAMAAHALANIFTFSVQAGTITAQAGAYFIVAVIAALAVAAEAAGRRRGLIIVSDVAECSTAAVPAPSS